MLVAKSDKRIRIEVGYGLEGVLTDVTSRRIIAENIAPEFSKGNFAAGINAGVDRIIAVVDAGEPLPALTPQRKAAPSRHFDFGTMLIVLLVAVPILGSVLRSVFGKVGGSLLGGGIVGAIAWFVASSLLIAGVAAVIGFIVMLFSGISGRGGGLQVVYDIGPPEAASRSVTFVAPPRAAAAEAIRYASSRQSVARVEGPVGLSCESIVAGRNPPPGYANGGGGFFQPCASSDVLSSAIATSGADRTL